MRSTFPVSRAEPCGPFVEIRNPAFLAKITGDQRFVFGHAFGDRHNAAELHAFAK
jgi:hypothetical protein